MSLVKWWMLFGDFLVLLMISMSSMLAWAEIRCPNYLEIPYCSCFVRDDQLYIQCSGSDILALQKSLQVLNGPVKSFSVYDLDSRATVLPNGVTDNVTSPVFHLQLSHSSLEDLAEGSLRGLSKSLESLAVVSARLKYIPQTTLSSLKRLKVLDFEGNQIQELGAYSFHNILLQKVNMKGNQLENVSELAFWGLEETMMEIDMSENKLKTFPFKPLQRLRLLSSLNLAWNEMSDLSVLTSSLSSFTSTSRSRSAYSSSGGTPISSSSSSNTNSANLEWPLLRYLNLNSNYLRKLDKDTFASMGNLRTLSIHLNSIELVDEDAFSSLKELESIDLSHNKITALASATFRQNIRLVSIDLSNNHIHLVDDGLFNNLGDLRELFLNGNNILQLTYSTFLGSHRISIIYLQGNAISLIQSGVFTPLQNLTEVRLSDNFLVELPQELFFHNEYLTSLSLDGNLLRKVVPGSFHNCKGLRELRLQNNQITAIPSGVIDVLPYLEEVHLENNKLTLIEGLDSLKMIRHVSLSRNSLETLTSGILPAAELSSLSLGHNALRTIEDGAFSNQTGLNILFLGNNRLTRLGPKMFSGLKSLERLYLQKNNITWIHNECFSSQTKAIQYIDLSYNFIKTINRSVFSGLAFIEEINLSHNQITNLEDGSFANLRSLRILDLSSNRLQSLNYPVTFHLSGLEILKICCNLLTDFQIYGGVGGSLGYAGSNSGGVSSGEKFGVCSGSNLPSGGQIGLKELDVRQNQLTASVLRQIEMGRLEVLQISGNNLTDIDDTTLLGFPALSFLAAEKAHITTLPGNLFQGNPNLAVIRLSDNSLTNIPDSVFTPNTFSNANDENRKSSVNLRSNLNSASSTSLPKSNPTLRELHLRHNRLRNWPYKALANASFLEVLTLSGNRINSLDLNRIRFPRLKQFDMNDNRLTKILGSSLTKSMPLLEVADFGENNISRVSEEFVKNLSLTQINFGGNSLQKIPFAFSEKHVYTSFVLNMSGNPLVNFYTENHPSMNFSVMDLYLSGTDVKMLTSEEFKIYPKLHRLVIKKNPITALPSNAFSSLTHLNLLDLSENNIDDVKHESFTGLVQLKSLNLSRNRIKSLPSFHPHLAGLQDLDLSSNQLSVLNPEIFVNLVSLVSLRLGDNWLQGLPTDLFGPLARLSVLDVSGNKIETIPIMVLRQLEIRISTLRLEGNEWSCECSSKIFWDWLQLHPKIFVGSATSAAALSPSLTSTSDSLIGESNLICAKPEELCGRPMMGPDLFDNCSSPAILKLAIQDIRPSTAVVSWQARNNSGMHGYLVAYHAMNHDNTMKARQIPATKSAYRIPDLESDTPYKVCVLGLAKEENSNITVSALAARSANELMKDSLTSKCTEVRTTSVHIGDGGQGSLLQRRLGVVVGAVVGVVVFFVLITTLACVKFRKRRILRQQNGKLDPRVTDSLTNSNNVGPLGGYHHHNNHQHHSHHHHHGNGNGTTTPGNLSPEFLTYRHYSITTDGGLHHRHQQPSWKDYDTTS